MATKSKSATKVVVPSGVDEYIKASPHEAHPKLKAIVSFPVDKPTPKALVKKLVKASIKVMKQNSV